MFILFLLMLGLPAAWAQIGALQNPRIAVIVPETHIKAGEKSVVSDPVGESAIIRKLLEAGFDRVVDKNQIDKIRESDVVKQLIVGDTAAAAALGTQLGVDYILVGEAFSEFVGTVGGGLVSCRSRLDARLIKTDNGQILATNGFTASGADIAEFTASKKSLNSSGEKMGDYMIERFRNYAGKTATGARLTITGVSSFSKVSELEKNLRGLNGVTNVYIREYNAGVAAIDLDITVSVQTLANGMSGIKGLEVTEISGSAMKASMR